MSNPGFFVYRDTTAGEPMDPCATLQFFPAKDSDELFFALKTAYPLVKTHSERMRNAVIDFLIKERDEEQARSQMPFPVDASSTFESTTASPWSTFPSVSSSSTLSSPDLIDLATPASFTSPPMPTMPSMPSMNRHSSQASSNSASTPAIDQMTSVFSLSDHAQPKTRIRRKMTESEKAEYRKRRLVKACDKCSKRKRKCNHNQTEMQTVASQQKVTKRKSVSSSSSSMSTSRTVEDQSAPPSAVMSEMFSFNDEPLFGLAAPDENDLFNLLDFNMAPPQNQNTDWPWSESQDWTLLDTDYPVNHYPNKSSDALFASQALQVVSSGDAVSQSASNLYSQDLQEGVLVDSISVISSDRLSTAPYSAVKRREASPADGLQTFVESSNAGSALDFSSRQTHRQQANVISGLQPSPQELLHNDGPSSALCWAEADDRTASDLSSFGNGAARSAGVRTQAYSKSRTAIEGSFRQQLFNVDNRLEANHRGSANAEPSPTPCDGKQTKTNSNGAGPRKALQQQLDNPGVLRVQASDAHQGLEHAARASGDGLTGVYASLPTSRISSVGDLSGRTASGTELSGVRPTRSNRGLPGEETSASGQKDGHTQDRHNHPIATGTHTAAAARMAATAVQTHGRKPTLASSGGTSTISSPQTAQQGLESPSLKSPATHAVSPSPTLRDQHPHEFPTIANATVVRGGSARVPRHVLRPVGTAPTQNSFRLSRTDRRIAATSEAISETTLSLVSRSALRKRLFAPSTNSASPTANPSRATSTCGTTPALSVANAIFLSKPASFHNDTKEKQNRYEQPALLSFGSRACSSQGDVASSSDLQSAVAAVAAMALLNAQMIGLIGAIGGALVQCLMDGSAVSDGRKKEGSCLGVGMAVACC